LIASDERVARFVSERLGFALCPPYTCMGIERDGEIVAGAVFNCFERHDVHVSLAGTGWTRGFVKAVGAYVFGQLGCLRMTATSEHDDVIEYARRLGGKVEGRLRDHFGEGRDGIVVGILRREWPHGIE
jgi:RimJ/RimL family protein N-acetyltransferase